MIQRSIGEASDPIAKFFCVSLSHPLYSSSITLPPFFCWYPNVLKSAKILLRSVTWITNDPCSQHMRCKPKRLISKNHRNEPQNLSDLFCEKLQAWHLQENHPKILNDLFENQFVTEHLNLIAQSLIRSKELRNLWDHMIYWKFICTVVPDCDMFPKIQIFDGTREQ